MAAFAHCPVKWPALVGLLGLAAGSCAWIVTGTSQAVRIESSPSGADCRLIRGDVIVRQFMTPATVTVRRRKEDLSVSCEKQGAGTGAVVVNAGTETWVWGNAASGMIGWGIDSAVGADNAYPAQITVALGPAPGSPPLDFGSAPMVPNAVPSPETPSNMPARYVSPEPAVGSNRFGVHLGTYATRQQAQQAWGFFRNASAGRIADANAFVSPRAMSGGTAYDLYAAKLSQDSAVGFCASLLDQQQNCQVVYY